jgi:hypothetical protein
MRRGPVRVLFAVSWYMQAVMALDALGEGALSCT